LLILYSFPMADEINSNQFGCVHNPPALWLPFRSLLSNKKRQQASFLLGFWKKEGKESEKEEVDLNQGKRKMNVSLVGLENWTQKKNRKNSRI